MPKSFLGDGQPATPKKNGPSGPLDAGQNTSKRIGDTATPRSSKQQGSKPRKPKDKPNVDRERTVKPKKGKGTPKSDDALRSLKSNDTSNGNGQQTLKPKKGKARPAGDGQPMLKPKKGKARQKKRQQKEKEALAACVTCPICLQNVEEKNVAILPTCLHKYCVFCIVRWAEEKAETTCPQCKTRFDSVMTRRRLDGTICDRMAEESVCLVKRANWYLGCDTRDYKFQTFHDEECDDDWEDDYCYEDEIDDAEDYYFSRAAGSARIVFSNRTFGKNGYIQAGRIYAQPAQSNHQPKAKNCVQKEPSVRPSGRIVTKAKGKKTLKREQRKREEAFFF